MSSNAPEAAISAMGIGKCYHIYERPQDRLKQAIVPRLWKTLSSSGVPHFYKEFWALKDVSFEITRGETVGVIGRNGSGKSTLLQMICGTLMPTTGEIAVHGRVAALLELGAGFNPEFTGRENVYMNAAIMGLSPDQIGARYDDIVVFADIGDFIDQPVKTYSSGMYVRLAFAVVAHVDADILIIDEALAVGDAYFMQKCMRFLRQFRERGTIVFASHDSGAVVNLCHRALWLEKGMLQAAGAAKEVCESYLAALVEAQQGSPVLRVGRTVQRSAEAVRDIRKDQRLEFLNYSRYRNDIELFEFRPDAPSFGKRGCTILDVRLLSEQGETLSWIVGGEIVVLWVRAQAEQAIGGPIIGFILKDKLGQVLFADNTFLTYAHEPLKVKADQVLEAQFTFRMPILPVGDYAVTVAVAEGTQMNCVQHHWIHDALMLKSHSSSVCTGLVGIPMHRIELNILPAVGEPG
jgi:lipopolysaccharide transport system ATP-binding protein